VEQKGNESLVGSHLIIQMAKNTKLLIEKCQQKNWQSILTCWLEKGATVHS
jgi:hypothetical protein